MGGGCKCWGVGRDVGANGRLCVSVSVCSPI